MESTLRDVREIDAGILVSVSESDNPRAARSSSRRFGSTVCLEWFYSLPLLSVKRYPLRGTEISRY
jgi:hypothetical protein